MARFVGKKRMSYRMGTEINFAEGGECFWAEGSLAAR